MKEWWLAIFTNAIVILGWFIIFQQTQSIKTREETRSLITDITILIDDIYTKTITYYGESQKEHISHLSSEIKSKFTLLSQMLLMIKQIDKQKLISPVLVEFKLHCTGGYFETVDFKKQSDVPNWEGKLAASAADLKLKIQQNYFRKVGILR